MSGAAPALPTTADSGTCSQTPQALYDAVVARYSSPRTAALGRLLLPYLFPELSAFATVEDLVSHLHASNARYRTADPAEFLDRNPPLMFITLYFIVTRLLDSLRSVRDHFLSHDPTVLTVDLLEQHLLAAETSVVAVGATRGTPRTPFFEGCSPSPLAPSYASVAVVDVLGAEDVGAASASAKHHSSKGKGGRGGGGGSGSGGGGSNGGSGGSGGSGGGGSGGSGGGSGGVGGGGGGSGGSGGGRTGAPRGAPLLLPPHDAWRAEFGDEVERPHWVEQLSPSIEAAALGATESSLPGTALAEALHNFTLDSGASRCFFRDSTTLTPLPAPVMVRLADPSRGPVVARSSTVLSCPAVPSSSLSGLHLPSFSTNLVSTAALQDSMVTTTTPGGSSLYTLATEPPQVAAFAQVSASGQVAPPCSCRLLSHQTLLWHHRLGHHSLPHLRGMHSRLLVSGLPRSLPPLPPSPAPPCLLCVEGRQRAAPHSFSFPPTTAPLQTLHMDVWGPARVSGQGCERYVLLVVDDYTRYTTVFPFRSKGEVVDVLIPWIRAVRLQLRKRFRQDLPILCPHSDRGGEFSSELLRNFCRAEGILQSFTLPASPQQNGIAERRIGLVMEVARTSMIHAAAPHFLWPFAVRYATHQLNLWPRSCAFVRDTSADKLSARAIPCVFLRFPPDAPGWQFYHPTSRRVFPSQDVTFDESVPFYHLFPNRSAPPPPPSLFLAPEPLPGTVPVEVAGDSGAARGTASGGGKSVGAKPGGAESEGAGSGGAELAGAEPAGVEPGGAKPVGAEPAGVEPGGAETSGVGGAGAGDPIELGAAGTGVTGAGGARDGGAGAGDISAGGAGARGAGAGGAGAGGAGARGAGAGGAGGTVRRSYRASGGRVSSCLYCSHCSSRSSFESSSCRRHARYALRPSSVPLRVPLLPPRESSLPTIPDPESGLVRAASPTVSRLLATVVTDPSFESTTASVLLAELLDFAAAFRLDYTSALVAEAESASPMSVWGKCGLGTDVLEDRQEDFECLAAAVPRFASMLLAPEGDPDAPDIPTPRSYAEEITGPYSSQWQAAMDAEMASRKATGTYVDAVPPSRANIVDGMWIFRVKRLPGSPPAFKARYVARGFSQQQGVDYFQNFSPTPKMTTLRVLLHVAAQGTQWSLRQPVYGLRQAPREWHDTLRTTLVALGFAPSTTDPSLFLRIDTSLPPFYGLVHVDDLVFATADTEALTLLKSELQKRHTWTDLGPSALRFPVLLATAHSSVYRPLALSSTFRLVRRAEWHRKVLRDAAKRVLLYLCSTSGMGLVLGGKGPVVLTGHADAPWVDDSATQWSSQGYTLSLGSGSVSRRSTRSSSVLSSSCEAEIYAGAMAAQELRSLTYLLSDLGEQPRSPPVLYLDNKVMIALCQEHRVEHQTKHITLRDFLARELQQRGRLRLAYVATRANTADIFTKALQPGDHQRFSTMLGLVPTLPHLLTA
ncbi:unnamed protein product [Closterium sp. NIES-53]